MSPRIITISGPTASGKTTLKERLCMEHSGEFAPVVTVTTRKEREGEVNGTDYHFLNHAEFQHKDEEGGFLETVDIDGRHYGVPVDGVLDNATANLISVLAIDPEGVINLNKIAKAKNWPEPLNIYLDNDLDTLIDRILERQPPTTQNVDILSALVNNLIAKEMEWIHALEWDAVFYGPEADEALSFIIDNSLESLRPG